jgi:hypothetical protein
MPGWIGAGFDAGCRQRSRVYGACIGLRRCFEGKPDAAQAYWGSGRYPAAFDCAETCAGLLSDRTLRRLLRESNPSTACSCNRIEGRARLRRASRSAYRR